MSRAAAEVRSGSALEPVVKWTCHGCETPYHVPEGTTALPPDWAWKIAPGGVSVPLCASCRREQAACSGRKK